MFAVFFLNKTFRYSFK